VADSEELKKIKKIYGERFMHLCRTLFPTLLETEGKLLEILTMKFSNNCQTLYDDITNSGLEEDFKNFVYSHIDMESFDKKIIVSKTPYELLDEAGYDLFECNTEEEIQAFKKYYASQEELCTFNGGRLNRCVCFFAVRKDVDDIKRENFDTPKRDDEYGTSVMGIQFNKEGMCTVSIKNRYNHTVNNPDATYGNDLDRITPGLTQSFSDLLKQRGLELNSSNIEKFELPGYVVASDGKYYKYNMEIDGTYYCPGNVVIEGGNAKKIEKEGKQLLIDCFVLNTEQKTIQTYDSKVKDSFTDDLTEIEKVEIIKNREKGNGTRKIIVHKKQQEHPIVIEINKNNEIIGYTNQELTHSGMYFLNFNQGLMELYLPQLQKVDNSFLRSNLALTELALPQLKEVGNAFLPANKILSHLELPQLKKVGDDFLRRNRTLAKLDLPQLQEIGNDFLLTNTELSELSLPQLRKVGDNFLHSNYKLTKLELLQLQETGHDFLFSNIELAELNLPQLQKVKDNFLFTNYKLAKLDLPQLQEIGNDFFLSNIEFAELSLPQLQKGEDNFLLKKQTIKSKDIAELDKENELTISEVNWGRKILEKIMVMVRNLFQKEDDKSER